MIPSSSLPLASPPSSPASPSSYRFLFLLTIPAATLIAPPNDRFTHDSSTTSSSKTTRGSCRQRRWSDAEERPLARADYCAKDWEGDDERRRRCCRLRYGGWIFSVGGRRQRVARTFVCGSRFSPGTSVALNPGQSFRPIQTQHHTNLCTNQSHARNSELPLHLRRRFIGEVATASVNDQVGYALLADELGGITKGLCCFL